MLDLSNSTIYTDLEHNGCTIALLVIHTALLLWTLLSCSVISVMVHLLPSFQSLHHMLFSQYSMIGYFTALYCILMSSIDVIMLGEWRLGSITCNMWYTVDTVLNTTGAWLSTSIMLERLVCIEAPQFHLNLSKTSKNLVACSPWVLSILLTLLEISFQHGGLHNFVSNNTTLIDQCYIVDQNNESAIYSATVSFMLPHAITLSLFIAIKSKVTSNQTRLTLSKNQDNTLDVLLDSDPEESINIPSCFSEHNNTPTPEDTVRKVHILADTCHGNRQLEDVYDKTSPNGHSLYQTRKVYSKSEASNPGYHYIKTRRYTGSTCACSDSLPDKVTGCPHRSHGVNCTFASELQNVRTKAGFDDKHIHKKGHMNVNRKPKPISFPSLHKKTKAKHSTRSTSSAYITALDKVKDMGRVKKAYQKMSNDTNPHSKHTSKASCARHTSAKKIEHIYVDKNCTPVSIDQSDRTEQCINDFCSLHAKQCQSVTRYSDSGDDSSSDSKSSHGLIQKDDNTDHTPKREHIILTNILQSEHLETVHHISIVVFLYAILWLPFYILRLLLRFSPQVTIYHYVYTSVHLLGYLTSGICPWLYYLLHGYMNSSTWSNMKYRILNPSGSDLSNTSSI